MGKYIIKKLNEDFLDDKDKFIANTEERYFNQLKSIVDDIKKKPEIKYVLISGPSSSGKTTTAKYFCNMLTDNGLISNYVSLDDFFLPRDKTPVLPNGDKDFESIFALDIDEIKKCFSDLTTFKKAKFPYYDFLTGINTKNVKEIELKENSVVVIEGNHAFNPIIAECLDTDKFIRVFIYPEHTFINEYDEDIITPIQLRLIRRTIRDVGNRGYMPSHTFSTWKNVLDGENIYINPYKYLADYVIDSAYAYEPMVYKTVLSKLLKDDNSSECKQIFLEMQNFEKMSVEDVPKRSLMWEFLNNLKI